MDDQRIDFRLLETGQIHITLKGEFDLADQARLQEAIAFGTTLSLHAEVDMSEVSFLDSTIMGWLVRAHREAESRQGSFTVVNPSERVRRLFDLLKLDDVLNVEQRSKVLAP